MSIELAGSLSLGPESARIRHQDPVLMGFEPIQVLMVPDGPS
jgi:hypothetical protein